MFLDPSRYAVEKATIALVMREGVLEKRVKLSGYCLIANFEGPTLRDVHTLLSRLLYRSVPPRPMFATVRMVMRGVLAVSGLASKPSPHAYPAAEVMIAGLLTSGSNRH